MGFKRLDAEDFVVSADSVQSTAWSTGLPTLTSFYTSSVQAGSTSGNFYLFKYLSKQTLQVLIQVFNLILLMVMLMV